MSYCVNCGVELDTSAKKCPLCETPVIHPKELEKMMQAEQPFPKAKGEVESVKRKDLGILLSVVVLATSITCGALNALVFQKKLWSLAVIGACAILWVLLIPVVIYKKQSVYLTIIFDGAVVAAYLYMLTYLTDGKGWFYGLGLPIVILITALAELFAFSILKLPRSFLTITLYIFTAIGLLCLGLEILIDRFAKGQVSLSWSAVVLTVCIIIDITLITMLSHRRLRNAVRKRLHF